MFLVIYVTVNTKTVIL